MSRLAKKPITILQGVTLKKEGGFYVFKGPKGEIKKIFSSYVDIVEKDGAVLVSLKASAHADAYALLGTSFSIVKNCLFGVSNGFEKRLEIEGIGYKAQIDGNNLSLSLGFTHPVKIQAPEGIIFKVEKNVIVVSGADKEKVGQISAEIRNKKPPEPYKGKGIHYLGEVIRRKAGKKAVAAG